MNMFKSLESSAARIVGDAEDLVHVPLYPIKHYAEEVTPNVLWRGSWPFNSQLTRFKQSGIVCVINLCEERNQDRAVRLAGMIPLNIPIRDNDIPELPQVRFFFEQLDMARFSFVHCEAGVGRTGCMIAAYRVLRCGWTPEQALDEERKRGLSLPNQVDFIMQLKAKG